MYLHLNSFLAYAVARGYCVKSVGTIIGACLIILLLSSILVGINTFRSTDHTESHGHVETGAAVTSADVVLTLALFDATIANATVTSNTTLDIPLVTAYTSSTKALTVTGLHASDNRTLTIAYKIGDLDSYLAADLGSRLYPVLLVLGVIGIIIGAVVNAFKRTDE